MPLMTRKTFKELAEANQRPSVSIYLPTERVGDNKKAQIRLKNLIQDVRSQLREEGMQENLLADFTTPLQMLLDDTDIWRHMSDGLAVFLSPGKFAYSTFPLRFSPYAEVDSHFYLLPLIPVFNGDGRFFILGLSLNKVRLFEGTRDHVVEIGIDDLVPQNMQESLGEDYVEKSLQFRSGQTPSGHGMYHGQGRAKDDRKGEITKHLREINRSLVDVLQGYDAPLVVACVDFLFPLYRKIQTYTNLFPQNVSGNPDEMHMQELHRKTWPLLESHFLGHREETLKHYRFLESKGRTTSILADVVLAAREGRIETLFIEKGRQVLGVFVEKSNGVEIQNEKTPENHCLLDTAAKEAILNGARTYLLDRNEMPEKEAMITATLRY